MMMFMYITVSSSPTSVDVVLSRYTSLTFVYTRYSIVTLFLASTRPNSEEAFSWNRQRTIASIGNLENRSAGHPDSIYRARYKKVEPFNVV